MEIDAISIIIAKKTIMRMSLVKIKFWVVNSLSGIAGTKNLREAYTAIKEGKEKASPVLIATLPFLYF